MPTPNPPDVQPDEVPDDRPREEIVERQWPEGQIPGLPVSRDPLREPGPTSPPAEKPPID